MIWLLPGFASFVCFLLFDYLKAKNRPFAPILFLVGALLLVCSTGGVLFSGETGIRSAWRISFGIFALFWLLAMLYVLFGALPAKKVYTGSGNIRVCNAGPYALCRHPGGWCFLFLYWFLWLSAPSMPMLMAAIIFPGLNFVYIWVQDRHLFPKYIEGYDSYKKDVPFIFPTSQSIRNALKQKPDQLECTAVQNGSYSELHRQ